MMLPPFHIVITSLNVGRLIEATSQIALGGFHNAHSCCGFASC
jgi:hypothetical protein